MKTNSNSTKSKRVAISPSITRGWDKLISHGSIAEISRNTGLSVATISNALKGLGTQETVTKLSAFFQKSKTAA